MLAIFPRILQLVKEGDIEEIAVEVRKYYATDQNPPHLLDIEKLLNNIGIEIDNLPLQAHAVQIVEDKQGKFRCVFVLNKSFEPSYRDFTLAHMLGHYILHIQPKIAQGEWNASGFRETEFPQNRFCMNIPYTNDEQQEQQADEFAASLLLPKAMLLKAHQKLNEVSRISNFFRVEEAIVQTRLSLLEKIKPQTKTSKINKIAEPQKTPNPVLSPTTNINSDEKKDFMLDQSLANDMPDVHMPRSFASAQYTQAQSIQKSKINPDVKKTIKGLGGMERIREIAKLIDKKPKQ